VLAGGQCAKTVRWFGVTVQLVVPYSSFCETVLWFGAAIQGCFLWQLLQNGEVVWCRCHPGCFLWPLLQNGAVVRRRRPGCFLQQLLQNGAVVQPAPPSRWFPMAASAKRCGVWCRPPSCFLWQLLRNGAVVRRRRPGCFLWQLLQNSAVFGAAVQVVSYGSFCKTVWWSAPPSRLFLTAASAKRCGRLAPPSKLFLMAASAKRCGVRRRRPGCFLWQLLQNGAVFGAAVQVVSYGSFCKTVRCSAPPSRLYLMAASAIWCGC
jgi:hypothetical protein